MGCPFLGARVRQGPLTVSSRRERVGEVGKEDGLGVPSRPNVEEKIGEDDGDKGEQAGGRGMGSAEGESFGARRAEGGRKRSGSGRPVKPCVGGATGVLPLNASFGRQPETRRPENRRFQPPAERLRARRLPCRVAQLIRCPRGLPLEVVS